MTHVKWSNRNFVPSFAGLIDDLVSEVSAPFTGRVHTGTGSVTIPRINVSETEDNYSLELAAPGLSKQHFALSVEEDVLTIEAVAEEVQHAEETTESETTTVESEDVKPAKRYTRREFNYSSFKRTFTLPEDVDADAISAAYEQGILVLTLPKLAKVQPKAIEIAIN